MGSDKQKRTSVAYSLDVIKSLIDALIEDIEAKEGGQSPLSKKLKQIKNEV